MKRRLVFQPEAEADLTAIVELYDNKRHGLGRELLAAVERALTTIADAPGAQPLFIPGRPLRKYTLARFPCVIVFREHGSDIVAMAVIHAKRRPADKANRASLQPVSR